MLFRSELEEVLSEYVEGNSLNEFQVIHGESVETDLDWCIKCLDPREGIQSDRFFTLKSAKQNLAFARNMLVLQRALKALPLRLGSIPAELFVYGANQDVSVAWITTQILLSALDAPAKDLVIKADDFDRAVTACNTRSKDEIVSFFFKRMKAAGMKELASDEEQSLLLHLQGAFGEVPKYSRVATTSVRCFLDMSDIKQTLLTHDEGLKLLLEVVTEENGFNKLVEFGDKTILACIDWSLVMPSEITLAMERHASDHLIADGILRMTPEHRREAAQSALSRPYMRKQWKKLIQQGAAPICVSVVAKHGGLISTVQLEENLDSLVQEIQHAKDVEAVSECAEQLLRVGALFESWVQSPQNRWNFVKSIMAWVVFDFAHRNQALVPRYRACFTEESWQKLCLATMVMLSSPKSLDGGGIYEDLFEEIAREDYQKWPERFLESDKNGLQKITGYTFFEGTSLMARYSEKEIFGWLYEYRGGELKELWEVYSEVRDSFYKFWASQPKNKK